MRIRLTTTFFKNAFTYFSKYPKLRYMETKLKKAYNNGRCLYNKSKYEEEPPNLSIVNEGKELRESLINLYKDKYINENYRILFQMPSPGVGVIWFNDLIECMEHLGIKCLKINRNINDFENKWNEFKPNIFISQDEYVVQKSLNLDFINKYKKENGLLRLFAPIEKTGSNYTKMLQEDKFRFNLAAQGKTVDAYFSMYHDGNFDYRFPEWKAIGFKHFSFPFGSNPFHHYPLENNKVYDYFMATAFGYVRTHITYCFNKDIFNKYFGVFGGPDWKFGEGYIDQKQLLIYNSKTKIILNPLKFDYIGSEYSELTERAFTTAACGAFQLTHWTKNTNHYFNDDELCAIKSNKPKDYIEAFDFYINNPEERNKIAYNGMRRMFKEHTYFHRIDKLVDFLKANKDLF